MDHYALAMQMGTSVKMIEQHYGHITPAHIAAKLASMLSKLPLIKPSRDSRLKGSLRRC